MEGGYTRQSGSAHCDCDHWLLGSVMRNRSLVLRLHSFPPKGSLPEHVGCVTGEGANESTLTSDTTDHDTPLNMLPHCASQRWFSKRHRREAHSPAL